MDVQSQTADSLSLSSVKEHLNVDFSEDDTIIRAFADASLEYVQTAVHKSILYTTYTNTVDELLPIDSYFRLRIPNKPEEVVMTSDGEDITLFTEDYIYDKGYGILLIPDMYDDVTAFVAHTGWDSNTTPLIDQARKMLIANWYAFREADFTSTIKEVPNGVERMLDLVQASPV